MTIKRSPAPCFKAPPSSGLLNQQGLRAGAEISSQTLFYDSGAGVFQPKP